MSIDVKIRRAVATDCPRILELVRELAEYEKAPQEVTVSLEHFTESGFGEKPVWWAFVADAPHPGGEIKTSLQTIVGIALYYIRFSTWKGQTLYLEDILVTEKMRGQISVRCCLNGSFRMQKRKDFPALPGRYSNGTNRPSISIKNTMLHLTENG